MARKRRSFGRIRQERSGRYSAAYIGPDTKLHHAPGSHANFRAGGVNANYFTSYANSVGVSAATSDIFAARMVPFVEHAVAPLDPSAANTPLVEAVARVRSWVDGGAASSAKRTAPSS